MNQLKLRNIVTLFVSPISINRFMLNIIHPWGLLFSLPPILFFCHDQNSFCWFYAIFSFLADFAFNSLVSMFCFFSLCFSMSLILCVVCRQCNIFFVIGYRSSVRLLRRQVATHKILFFICAASVAFEHLWALFHSHSLSTRSFL